MKATVISSSQHIEIKERPTPEPKGTEVRIRVVAAAMNRADLLQRDGQYPAPQGSPSDVPGLEFAGYVDSLGERTSLLQVGDRVMGICGGGAQAEYVIVEEGSCIQIPPQIPDEEAAALPEAFMTAHESLMRVGRAEPDDWVLINAAASGIGTATAQLAAANGIHIIGTTRTFSKSNTVKRYGFAHVLVDDELGTDSSSYREIRRLTAGGPRIVIDLLGGESLNAGIDLLRPDGRLVLLGFLRGATATIALQRLVGARLTIAATSIRGRSQKAKAALADRFRAEVLPLIASGQVRAVVDHTYTLEDIKKAYQHLESNTTIGKIVIRVAG